MTGGLYGIEANIFIIDSGNARVVKLNPSGHFLNEFGSTGSL